MKYKNLLLGGIAFVLAIFYALFKRAPTIQQSLTRDGFKLVSNSDRKAEIYKEILERHKEEINSIALDKYLIDKNRKWEALSFWCDTEFVDNSLFRKLHNHKKLCVMAILDMAKDENKEILSKIPSEKFMKFKKSYFKELKDDPEEINKKRIEWCEVNQLKPFWRETKTLFSELNEYCYST